MEALILAALLYANRPAPTLAHQCPKAFVNAYRANPEVARTYRPRQNCWVPDEAGKFLCTPKGCLR